MGLHRWISRVPGSARRPKAVVAVLLALAALLVVGQAALAQTPPSLTSGSSVSVTPDGGVIFSGQSVGLSATEYASAQYSWSSDGASFSPSDGRSTMMTVNSGASGDITVTVTVSSGSVSATGSATFTVPPADQQLAEGAISMRPASVSLTPGQNVILEADVLSAAGGALASGAPGVSYSWSSNGGGSVSGNADGNFVAPSFGFGTVTLNVTQSSIGGDLSASGTVAFDVILTPDRPGVEIVDPDGDPPNISFPAAGSVVTPSGGASVTTSDGVTVEVPRGAINGIWAGVYVESAEVELPEGLFFTVGSSAVNIVFTDANGNAMDNFLTHRPVRVCMPITQDDIDTVWGGIDGIHIARTAPGGGFVHYPPENDLAAPEPLERLLSQVGQLADHDPPVIWVRDPVHQTSFDQAVHNRSCRRQRSTQVNGDVAHSQGARLFEQGQRLDLGNGHIQTFPLVQTARMPLAVQGFR